MVIQSVDTTSYPEVELRLLLAPELITSAGLSDKNFSLAENGAEIPVKISSLPAERDPIAVVLAIDTSGSMKGKPLQDAKSAAKSFFDVIKKEDQVAVVSFSSQSAVAADFTNDRGKLVSAIDALQASGETSLYDAIVTAVNISEKATPAQKNMILLSDGKDTQSINSLDNALNSLRGAKVPLYGIALSSPEADPKTLELMVRQSNGKLIPATDSAKLSAVFQQIAEEIQNRFRLTFTSAEPQTKDIEIEVEASVGSANAAAATVIKNPEFARSEQQPTSSVPPAGAATSLLLLTVALTFVSFGLLGYGSVMILQPEPTTLRQLRFYEQLQEAGQIKGDSGSQQSRLKQQMVEAIEYAAGKRGLTKALLRKLEQAGLPLRPSEYMFFHALTVVGLGLLTQIFTGRLPLSIIVVILSTFVPLLVLETLISKRRTAFQEQLPDMLNFVSGSLRAGHGLLQAITMVEKETKPPMSAECRRVLTEARLGLSLEEALEKMAERLDSDDFRWTAAAINIQRDAGGNLAELLDIIAKTVRARETVRRQIRSLTAEGRFSAIILVALPFVEAFFLYLINPTYFVILLTSGVGVTLLIVGSLLLLAGAVWLRRIVQIEV